jgi:hypothetical protein
MTFKYLTEDAPGVFHLSHLLTPEVRAMFCAMASRAPLGGIKARYGEIVEAVAESIWDGPLDVVKVGYGNKETLGESWKEAKANTAVHTDPVLQSLRQDRLNDVLGIGEDLLCGYPLHPRVQKFFDQFVKLYGHSSILELTGSPSVYIEGVSWWTAYRSFDNPLVSGQEFSTRAVRHKDWPMARECLWVREMAPHNPPVTWGTTVEEWHPTLKALHEAWFEVFEAEVEAWRVEYTSACHICNGERGLYSIDSDFRTNSAPCPACKGTGKKYPSADKEPFRPALDRARWAIPGTIATGFAHTANLRVMARVIQEGQLVAQASGAPAVIEVWNDIAKGYAAALPGLAEMGLREAVYKPGDQLSAHLTITDIRQEDAPDDVSVVLHPIGNAVPGLVRRRALGAKEYLDPFFNTFARVDIVFQCSLAVSRDWHRHRTLMPWYLDLVRDPDGLLQIHHAYTPMSAVGKEKLPDLLRMASSAYQQFQEAGDDYRAMLCLPLGTKVRMSGSAGLRDAVYCVELRRDAVGANFEYQDQAQRAVSQLVERLGSLDAALPAMLGLAGGSAG